VIQEEFKDLDARSQAERVKDFSDLLGKIEGVDDKKKQIWKEIYENAITDRQHAFVMFIKLAKITDDKTNEWAVHGKTMATFLERMSRANDQLIKLGELISRSDPSNSPIDSDDMFNMITKK
jgi:hypothetical protein